MLNNALRCLYMLTHSHAHGSICVCHMFTRRGFVCSWLIGSSTHKHTRSFKEPLSSSRRLILPVHIKLHCSTWPPLFSALCSHLSYIQIIPVTLLQSFTMFFLIYLRTFSYFFLISTDTIKLLKTPKMYWNRSFGRWSEDWSKILEMMAVDWFLKMCPIIWMLNLYQDLRILNSGIRKSQKQ